MSTVPSIFTRIINREIPATIVYEDECTIAFLTIEPISKGHTLIVPKVPFVNLFDGNASSLTQMMTTAQKVANGLIKSGLATGVNLIMNCGESAGQEVFHAHLHVVPRTEGDGKLPSPNHEAYQPNEAAAIGKLIADHV